MRPRAYSGQTEMIIHLREQLRDDLVGVVSWAVVCISRSAIGHVRGIVLGGVEVETGAADGQLAAALPTNAMNSRRLIRSPRQPAAGTIPGL
jgi:hypothetical protein